MPKHQDNAPYFGETIGRIANRVAKGKFELNGKSHQLPINNGPNSLHGGDAGWGKREFEGPQEVERNGKQATLFKYLSKDGEEGYPGTVEVRVWYVQEKEQGQEVLHIEYEAELVGDVAETAVNITNHRYETTIVDLKALLILATATSTSPVLLLLLAPRSL